MGNSSNGRDRLLTVEDLAERLNLPASWIYAHLRKRSGDPIPGFRLGKYWRFREEEVLQWLERHKTGVRTNA